MSKKANITGRAALLRFVDQVRVHQAEIAGLITHQRILEAALADAVALLQTIPSRVQPKAVTRSGYLLTPAEQKQIAKWADLVKPDHNDGKAVRDGD